MQILVSPDPRKTPMSQAHQMVHEQVKGLPFVGHDRMTNPRIAHGNGDEMLLYRLDRFEELFLNLTEDRDADELMLPQIVLHRPHAQIVLRAEEDRMITF